MDAFARYDAEEEAFKKARKERKKHLASIFRGHTGLGEGRHDETGTRITADTPLKPLAPIHHPSPPTSIVSRAQSTDSDTTVGTGTRSSRSRLSGRLSGRSSSGRSSSRSGSRIPNSQLDPKRLRKDPDNILGSGAYGKVYLALNEITGELVAVKEIQFQGAGEELKAQVQAIAKEIRLMKTLKHPNIVKYLGAERIDSSLLICMEYVPGGSLARLMKKFGPLAERTVLSYTHQILEGLIYLHDQKIAHRDIKGDNLLLDVTGEVKLADFGTSRQVEDLAISAQMNSITGTPYFMAPEVIKGNGYTLSADIWSVGATLIELLTGKAPYSEITNPHVAMFKIATATEPPPLPTNISLACQDFLAQCMRMEPSDRPAASELLSCDFILARDESDEEGGSAKDETSPKSRNTEQSARFSKQTSTQPAMGEAAEADKKPTPLAKESPSTPRDKGDGEQVAKEIKSPKKKKKKKIKNLIPEAGNTGSTMAAANGTIPVVPLETYKPENAADCRAATPKAGWNCPSLKDDRCDDLVYLKKLNKLRKQGIITDMEFEAKKKQILWGTDAVCT